MITFAIQIGPRLVLAYEAIYSSHPEATRVTFPGGHLAIAYTPISATAYLRPDAKDTFWLLADGSIEHGGLKIMPRTWLGDPTYQDETVRIGIRRAYNQTILYIAQPEARSP